MVLSRPEILRYIREQKLRFDPQIDLAGVKQVSVDLRLGRKFTRFKALPEQLACIQMDKSIWRSLDIWEHLEDDTYLLTPGGFVLAQTLETIRIPNDLVGFVEGRSSWARIGVSIHINAPKIDPGFEAPITLEMANFGPAPVLLRAGVDQPAQLMLLRIHPPLTDQEIYGSGSEDSFQNQKDPIPYRK
jgi:dCTP deaminase